MQQFLADGVVVTVVTLVGTWIVAGSATLALALSVAAYMTTEALRFPLALFGV
jgi:hypothetical protein